MPRIVDASNIEKTFINEALISSQLRLDGRSLDQYRNVDISFDQQLGCATVSIGKTR